jgi:FkbM family methyltransferase
MKNTVRKFLSKKVKSHRIIAGELRGYQIYTSWFDYPAAILGYTEKQLLKWFNEYVLPGQTWLDIGAHYGFTSLALARLVGSTGRVFSFEPMVQTAGYLQATMLANQFTQVEVIPIGLSNNNEIKRIKSHVTRGMVDSMRNTGGTQSFLITSLDWFWDRIATNKIIHGIKIDVQGMEIDVIDGMRNILRTYRPKLIVEIHHGVEKQTLDSSLKKAGYNIVGVPIEEKKHEHDEISQFFSAMD